EAERVADQQIIRVYPLHLIDFSRLGPSARTCTIATGAHGVFSHSIAGVAPPRREVRPWPAPAGTIQRPPWRDADSLPMTHCHCWLPASTRRVVRSSPRPAWHGRRWWGPWGFFPCVGP